MKKLVRFMLLLIVVIGIFKVEDVIAASGIFPKMVPANSIDVYDCLGDSVSAKRTASALQGLMNQSQAKVFLNLNSNDNQWLDDSGKMHNHITLKTGTNKGLRTLYDNNKSSVEKFIVYDEQKDWTWNIALMKSSLEGGIPVTLSLKNELVAEFGAKPVEDIRNNWTDRLDAYQWARTNLAPYLNKDIMFSIGLRELDNTFTIYDYVVATKSFAFWLDNHNASEIVEIENICQMDGYGDITPIMGYGMHGDDLIEIVEPYGFGWVVSDFFSNATIWSSFPNVTHTQPNASGVTARNGKVYVSFLWSDGDNITFDLNVMRTIWSDPMRGQVPIGTTLGAALQEIAPPLLDWYYDNRTAKDELIAGPSGWQFVYSELLHPSIFDQWMELNRRWNEDAGFNIAATDGHWGGNININYLAGSGLDGVLLWDAGPYRIPLKHGDTVQISTADVVANYGEVYAKLSALTPDSTRPLFENIYLVAAPYGVSNGNGVGYTRLKAEIDRLNQDFPGRFEFMLPSSLMATAEPYAVSDYEYNQVTIKSTFNGQYVSAMDEGNSPLIANNSTVGAWEKFELIDLGNGEVAFRSKIYGKFVCAENEGNSPLIARSTAIGEWERFRIEHVGGGFVAIKSTFNGKYVCAENGGSGALIARSTSVGDWEKFIIEQQGHKAFASIVNKNYLSADDGISTPIKARSIEIGDWEKYTLVYLGNNNWAIKSKRNGYYLSADDGDNTPINARSTSVGEWETFQFIRQDDGKIAIKSNRNGKYLTLGVDNSIGASSDTVDNFGKFFLFDASHNTGNFY